MCGILYVKRKNGSRASKPLLKRYHRQKSRGSEGFGYIAIEGGKIKDIIRTKTEHEITRFLKAENASEIVFHHRFPTSTPNLAEMAHPIMVESPLLKHNYYLVHNGVITNAEKLREEHIKMGFSYSTDMSEIEGYRIGGEIKYIEEETCFNDSEALAIELALVLEGKKEKVESIGAVAFVLVEADKNDNVLFIHYGRNYGNPLVMEDGGDLFCLKSEGGDTVAGSILYSLNYKTKEVKEKEMEFGASYSYPTVYSGSKDSKSTDWMVRDSVAEHERQLSSDWKSDLPEGMRYIWRGGEYLIEDEDGKLYKHSASGIITPYYEIGFSSERRGFDFEDIEDMEDKREELADLAVEKAESEKYLKEIEDEFLSDRVSHAEKAVLSEEIDMVQERIKEIEQDLAYLRIDIPFD